MTGRIRTVLFSTLYPSSAQPLRGLFVETRLRELLRTGEIDTRVVAPVPWFHSTHPRHGRYAAMAATPEREVHNGVDVIHPRFLVIPRIGMNVAPFLLALGARSAFAKIIREGFDFDLIDAHYYYPDGVAAAMLGGWFKKPVVITARGTDLNLLPTFALPRAMIRWAARRASCSIGVSSALVERLRALEPTAARVMLMRNGIDLARFRPVPQALARRELGLTGSPVLLTVGNLHDHKGQRIVVDAFGRLRRRYAQASLVVVGMGPDLPALQEQVGRLGLEACTRFAGTVPNDQLAHWYSAADVSLLASSREGWPNVLLESMACGTPVVASAVGGVPEIVQSEQVGRLVSTRTAEAFEAAVSELLAAGLGRGGIRKYAEGFSWGQTSQDQLALFRSLSGARA